MFSVLDNFTEEKDKKFYEEIAELKPHMAQIIYDSKLFISFIF